MTTLQHLVAATLTGAVFALIAGAGRGVAASPPLPPTLTVHVVAHSHCDAGYHLSFEEYYEQSVRSILTTVVAALQEPPSAAGASNRTFVWEEVSFFRRWWSEQSTDTQQQVSALVASGALEFIGGGFVMHDEGATDLEPLLTQFFNGLQFLEQTLDVRPQFGWHIDPFGHSAFTPTLYALMGFSAFVGNRIPDPLKRQWRANQSLEFVWRANPELLQPNAQYELFTHILDSHYNAPTLHSNGVAAQAQELVDMVLQRAVWYPPHGHLLLPFGGDFQFTNATARFEQWEPLMAYANTQIGPQPQPNGAAPGPPVRVQFQFSTLRQYFSAVYSTQTVFTARDGLDLFPYVACSPCFDPQCYTGWGVPCGDPDAAWTGYFTSKPFQKWTARRHDAALRSAELLFALREQPGAVASAVVAAEALVPWPPGPDAIPLELDVGRNTSGIMQHHDAMPGTAFPPAYDDYNVRLNASADALDAFAALLKTQALTTKNGHPMPSPLQSATALEPLLAQLNASGNAVAVAVGNSLTWGRAAEPLRLGPISWEFVFPDGASGVVVTSAVSGAALASQWVRDTVRFEQWLYVIVPDVQGLQLQTLYITLQTNATAVAANAPAADVDPATAFSNGEIGLVFDSVSGRVTGWNVSIGGGVATPFSYELYRYSERAENDVGNVCTGANVYTFVPVAPGLPAPLAPADTPLELVWTATGPVVWEVTQLVVGYANVTYRLWRAVDGAGVSDPLVTQRLEVQTRLGPLPTGSGQLNSFVARFAAPQWVPDNDATVIGWDNSASPVTHRTSDAVGSGVQFSTWSSPTLSHIESAPGSGSDDALHAMTLTTQRPVGVSCGAPAADGQMEVMLHRRMTQGDPRSDDASVMDDPLLIALDAATASTDPNALNAARHQRVQRLQNPLTVHVALAPSVAEWQETTIPSFNPFKAGSLPPNIHLVALRVASAATQTANTITLWNTDAAPGTAPTALDLNALFASGELQLFQEMTVDGILPLAQMKRMQWLTNDDASANAPAAAAADRDADFDLNADFTPANAAAGKVEVGDGLPRVISMAPGAMRTFRFNFLI